MSTVEKAENRPSSPPPGDRPKEPKDDVVLAHQGGKMYEIPLSVVQQYESQDTHDQTAGDSEVGGRHRTHTNYGYVFHGDWQYGAYVWISTGRVYYGYHWHPNMYSFYAYDADNY